MAAFDKESNSLIDALTGDVVTLEEFESRIHGREHTKVKRNADDLGEIDDKEGHLEKRMCLRL